MLWALTRWPPTSSTSEAMLAVLTRQFSQKKLYMMLSPYTMLRSVLTMCSVKAPSCSSVLGVIFISYYNLGQRKDSVVQILKDFFSMSCHVEIPVINMRESESNKFKFNTCFTSTLWDPTTLPGHLTPGSKNDTSGTIWIFSLGLYFLWLLEV